MKRLLLIALLLTTMPSIVRGQTASGGAKPAASGKTWVERLGYPPNSKLLIVHVDDLGMNHSVNAASIKAFGSGLVNSGSIMVPCPWFAEIADYSRSRPGTDLGLHLTLTSEWKFFRWGPVLSKDRVTTLLDREGYLHPTESIAAARVDAREVEAEIRAQIERAKAFGIEPTHLDSHMGTLYQSKTLFETLLKVAHDNSLPVLLSREWFERAPFLPSILGPDDVLLDRIISIEPNVTPERWGDFYTEAIKSLQPGITQVILHLAYDDEEMRATTVNHPDWGAGWRQRDFDFFTGEKFRQLLREHDIKLVTWREIGKLKSGAK
ncbi:MAG TPA: polysaccharide deacetylase family protein [Blastocatellia bacterium]|nr:polysaccharide deacetylase family protein [Blastocatellia bacterium]